MENQGEAAQTSTIGELLQQASVEQDKGKLRDLMENVFLAIERGESPDKVLK
jgi:hypothetical protein